MEIENALQSLQLKELDLVPVIYEERDRLTEHNIHEGKFYLISLNGILLKIFFRRVFE